jgi:ribosome-associated heat shock protein Hsp15
MNSAANALRIDRWLFFTRFFKTRSLASAAVAGGHVKLNGERATPGARVKCDDIIDLVRERIPYRLTVAAIPARRGPASEAQSCFVEDPEALEKRIAIQNGLRQDRRLMPKTEGRPDKHTRRKLRDRNRGAE